MNTQNPAWEADVNNIKKNYQFTVDFNLAEHFRELHTITQRKDAFSNELHRRASDLKIVQSIIIKETKTLELLQQISMPTQNELDFFEQITCKQDLIQKLSNYADTSFIMNPGKKYPYSTTFIYIGRLVGIFHKGTGTMPICDKGQNHDDYSGNFYDFLLESKPLLKIIDIDLHEDSTIGKYANQHVQGYEKKGVQYSSYADLLEYVNSAELTQL